MNFFQKTVKPTSIILAIVFLLVSTSFQSASAAMIGTEKLLQAEDLQEKRDYLHQLIAREEVQSALTARGIDPLEAQLRLQSLTDEEIRLIADKLDELPAGRGVVTFSLIIVGVIIALVLIFNFTDITSVVAATLDRIDVGDDLDLDAILAADIRARELTRQEIEKRA